MWLAPGLSFHWQGNCEPEISANGIRVSELRFSHEGWPGNPKRSKRGESREASTATSESDVRTSAFICPNAVEAWTILNRLTRPTRVALSMRRAPEGGQSYTATRLRLRLEEYPRADLHDALAGFAQDTAKGRVVGVVVNVVEVRMVENVLRL